MTIRVHPQGLGESLGDDLIINGPLVHTANVWWVNSATGLDAASPQGLERTYPLATLAKAVSNAAHSDIIVLMDGHAETISTASPLIINKRLTIVGSGQSSGKPTVKLAFTGSAASPIQLTADSIELRNIWFQAQGTANSNPKIYSNTSNAFRMIGCYMECGSLDDGFGLSVDGTNSEVRNTTFVSTAGSRSTAAKAALYVEADGFRASGLTFDGGQFGWTNGWAMDLDNGSNVADLRMEDITLLRGSDIRITSGSTGWILANTGSYAPRIDWGGTAAS